MFIYFWLPNYLFEVLTFFPWMTWISPNNVNLEVLTGFKNGLGVRPETHPLTHGPSDRTQLFNPWPTFDWNVMLYDSLDPLVSCLNINWRCFETMLNFIADGAVSVDPHRLHPHLPGYQGLLS
jgi:hypothetical protein